MPHVAEIWRYPVKSLAGERLEVGDVRADGIAGDRLLQVRTARRGTLITARSHPRLLGLRAALGAAEVPEVEGRRWDSREARQALRSAAGPSVELVPSRERRFDDTPLLVATDGSLAALGIDRRRLRPNLVIGGVPGLAERDWPGCTLIAGEVEIAVEKLCRRCVVTTIDPDTLEQDAQVLERIRAQLEGRVALNCRVRRPGRIRSGDPVELV